MKPDLCLQHSLSCLKSVATILLNAFEQRFRIQFVGAFNTHMILHMHTENDNLEPFSPSHPCEKQTNKQNKTNKQTKNTCNWKARYLIRRVLPFAEGEETTGQADQLICRIRLQHRARIHVSASCAVNNVDYLRLVVRCQLKSRRSRVDSWQHIMNQHVREVGKTPSNPVIDKPVSKIATIVPRPSAVGNLCTNSNAT
jgi:hypothetical protein